GQQVASPELRTQLVDYRSGVARPESRVAAVVARAVVRHRACAAGGNLGLDVLPDIQSVADPGFEDDGLRSGTLDLHTVMQLVGGNCGRAGGDCGQQQGIELHWRIESRRPIKVPMPVAARLRIPAR